MNGIPNPALPPPPNSALPPPPNAPLPPPPNSAIPPPPKAPLPRGVSGGSRRLGLEPDETPPGGREMREPAGKIMYKITLLKHEEVLLYKNISNPAKEKFTMRFKIG
jgi:hypothetical protein